MLHKPYAKPKGWKELSEEPDRAWLAAGSPLRARKGIGSDRDGSKHSSGRPRGEQMLILRFSQSIGAIGELNERLAVENVHHASICPDEPTMFQFPHGDGHAGPLHAEHDRQEFMGEGNVL